jgi:hypothetical protein
MMPVTKEADPACWLIDDHGKQTCDVATEDTQVQVLQLGNGRELSAQ